MCYNYVGVGKKYALAIWINLQDILCFFRFLSGICAGRGAEMLEAIAIFEHPGCPQTQLPSLFVP